MTMNIANSGVKDPVECADMAEVRAGVDDVDAQVIRLLALRFAYMDAAARIKDDRDTVRDEVRKAQVIGNARRAALDLRLPQDSIGQIWDALVEASIAYELEAWDRLNRGGRG